jgi:hypothetical protein
MIFFVWLLGHNENTVSVDDSYQESTLQSRIGDREEDALRPSYRATRPDRSEALSSSDYAGPEYKRPKAVTKRENSARRSTAGSTHSSRSTARDAAAPATYAATAIRDWKGVHRDAEYARQCFERFRDDVMNLSYQYGLYPQVFMARIIAFSYEYVSSPLEDPIDNNFLAMKRPGGESRARFEQVEESLKAYAVVNAGEILRLSAEGALAKHERAWTMRKIIENNAFVENLGELVMDGVYYTGHVGPANEVPEEENDAREMVGETLKMASKVERAVKEQQAQEAGFDNWEDYLESLPEGQRADREKNTSAITSAILKKKSFNMRRRVNAKKHRRSQKSEELVLNGNR